jgi:DNA or RNA helicases of superfamily II
MKTKEKADFLFYADLDECRDQLSTRRPVKHQESAIYKLNDWFKSNEFPAGTIMVLPTGSGKTFTAVRFLCQKPLSDGYKVLWLAHTHHLLEQAFYSFIPKDKTKGGYEVGFIQNKDDIKIRVVSGASNNFNVNQIKKTDDIIIATLQTITQCL